MPFSRPKTKRFLCIEIGFQTTLVALCLITLLSERESSIGFKAVTLMMLARLYNLLRELRAMNRPTGETRNLLHTWIEELRATNPSKDETKEEP
jgi:hypothetical protein